jgi:hypothetical protein
MLWRSHAGFWLSCDNAIGQLDVPPPFAPIDGHGNFPLRRRAVRRLVENEEVGTELADRENVTVEAQMHPDVR